MEVHRVSRRRRAGTALRRSAMGFVRRARRRGRAALARTCRLTAATVVAFVVAEALGLQDPPPLIAALTALLVVQATLTSTLVTGIQRVLSVVAGVALAVLFVSVVGLTWWTLGALVAASLVVGQLLRLGANLVEVPISAMLVLGPAPGGEGAGGGGVVETLVGAAVGVLANVLFPPAVQTRHAGRAVERFATEIALLLEEAATALAAGPVDLDEAARWLDDARRLNRHAPRVDRALAHAEESRRLNLRALGTPAVGPGLREGLDALEHSSVSMRTLFRAVYDATREQIGVQEDPEYADEVRTSVAFLMREMAGVVRAFGLLLRREMETAGEKEEEQLAGTLEKLHKGRLLVEELLLAHPRRRHGLWELNSAVLTTVDRMLTELDVATHTRLRMTPVRSTARDRAMLAAERFRRTSRPRARRTAPSAGPGADEPNG